MWVLNKTVRGGCDALARCIGGSAGVKRRDRIIEVMSQERTDGDLRNTGLSLKHDRTWDYELDRIVEAVEERDAKKVGLQFPEGLKRRGPAVTDDLRELLPDDHVVVGKQGVVPAERVAVLLGGPRRGAGDWPALEPEPGRRDRSVAVPRADERVLARLARERFDVVADLE